MIRNGASFVLFSLGEMGYRTILLRLSAVLRNAVVMCKPLIIPDNCWHKTTWPEFQPSLPPGRRADRRGVAPAQPPARAVPRPARGTIGTPRRCSGPPHGRVPGAFARMPQKH